MAISFEEVDPVSTALIIIDMQNDYVHRDGAVIRHFRELSGCTTVANEPTPAELMVPTILKLINEARLAGVTIIWVITLQAPWTETPYWQMGRGSPTSEDPNWGIALYDGLAPRNNEPIVIKRRHSCFFSTDLDLILGLLKIERVIMTGVGTPYCVESSVRDAFSRGYQVITVSDATATREGEEHEAALDRITTAFGSVSTSAELIQAWHH